jgi:hypothetical protein
MSMRTIHEIEHAIGTLTPHEIEELYVWLDRHYPNLIDSRIPSDLAAGQLDQAIQRALEDEKSGRIRPL